MCIGRKIRTLVCSLLSPEVNVYRNLDTSEEYDLNNRPVSSKIFGRIEGILCISKSFPKMTSENAPCLYILISNDA